MFLSVITPMPAVIQRLPLVMVLSSRMMRILRTPKVRIQFLLTALLLVQTAALVQQMPWLSVRMPMLIIRVQEQWLSAMALMHKKATLWPLARRRRPFIQMHWPLVIAQEPRLRKLLPSAQARKLPAVRGLPSAVARRRMRAMLFPLAIMPKRML